MGQVRGQLRHELVDNVAEPLVAAGRVGRVDGRHQRLDDGMLGLQCVRQRHPVGLPGIAQRRPQGVIFGLVVHQQELLGQLPPQRGVQQRAGVAAPQARNAPDVRELPAQGVVHREHHVHVEPESMVPP